MVVLVITEETEASEVEGVALLVTDLVTLAMEDQVIIMAVMVLLIAPVLLVETEELTLAAVLDVMRGLGVVVLQVEVV